MVDRETGDAILAAQRNEITEHIIYERLSRSVKDPHNRKVLERIAGEELEHHDFWKRHTNEDVKPDRLKIWGYLLISRVFGIKLMERGEGRAEVTYENLSKAVGLIAVRKKGPHQCFCHLRPSRIVRADKQYFFLFNHVVHFNFRGLSISPFRTPLPYNHWLLDFYYKIIYFLIALRFRVGPPGQGIGAAVCTALEPRLPHGVS